MGTRLSRAYLPIDASTWDTPSISHLEGEDVPHHPPIVRSCHSLLLFERARPPKSARAVGQPRRATGLATQRTPPYLARSATNSRLHVARTRNARKHCRMRMMLCTLPGTTTEVPVPGTVRYQVLVPVRIVMVPVPCTVVCYCYVVLVPYKCTIVPVCTVLGNLSLHDQVQCLYTVYFKG